MKANNCDEKKNILIVHNYYKIPGGEDTVVANEKALLEAHGHNVFLYTRENAELEKQSIIQKFFLPINTIFSTRTYCEVKRIIKDKKIEILHVHNTLNLISPSVYYAGFHSRIPVIQTMHNFRLLCPGATFYRDGKVCEDCLKKGLFCSIKHRCYRGSALQTIASAITLQTHRLLGTYYRLNYICLTGFNKEKLLTLKEVDEKQVYLKPNFTPDCDTVTQERKYFLYLGRLEKIKGIEIILKSFQHLPYDLKVVGVGAEETRLKKLVERHKLVNIEFLGYKKGEELDAIFASAYALIAAPQWYETFGMTVIEAYAHHIPVIVGDIGNVSALVENSVTGLKFQHDSSEDLIRAVKDFMNLDYKTLGENAHRVFKERYSEEENYKILMNIYNNARV